MGESLHGTHPEEQQRLSALNAMLNERAMREIAVRPGERIVDFGSGLGQLTRAMAHASGQRVIAIERSAEQLAQAVRDELIEYRQGDAASPPLQPQEWGTFDLAHARFVLEHVRDPLAVVRQMARALKPGGRIILQDDDHEILRCHPSPPGFPELWKAYERSYDRLGCDPYVGRKLPALIHAAGLTPVRNTFLFFGSCAGEPLWRGLIENMLGLFEGARPQMPISDDEFAAALASFKAWSTRPDASFWYAIYFAEGLKPRASSDTAR